MELIGYHRQRWGSRSGARITRADKSSPPGELRVMTRNLYKLRPRYLAMTGTSAKTHCDRRGRIYLSGALRARYGERFRIIETPSGIVLLPIPQDLAAEFAELGKPLRSLTLEQIKARIAKKAREDATRGLR